MPKIITEIRINAPIEVCFDMARDIDIHTKTVWKHTNELAIAGRTQGKIERDEMVTFEARHFGIRQRLTSKIASFEKPFFFIDEMQRGAFKNLKHEHHFREMEGATVMKDILEFKSPFGIVGSIFDVLILKRYMRKFIEDRNKKLKQLIEEKMYIK